MGTGEMLVDLAEIVTPFAEWIHIDQLMKDVTGQGFERSGALGEQKARLYEQIRSLPMEEGCFHRTPPHRNSRQPKHYPP